MAGYFRLDVSRIRNEVNTMKIFCHAHPLAAVRPVLNKRGIIKASDLRRLRTDEMVRLTGLQIIYHTPPTRSGKRVMFLTLEDESGLFDVVVFENVQKRFARTILTSQVLTLEGKLQRRGVNGKAISIIMRRISLGLSGSLNKLLDIGAEETARATISS